MEEETLFSFLTAPFPHSRHLPSLPAVRTLAIKVNRPSQAITAVSVFTEPLLRHPARPESPALSPHCFFVRLRVIESPQHKFVPLTCRHDLGPRDGTCCIVVKKKRKKEQLESTVREDGGVSVPGRSYSLCENDKAARPVISKQMVSSFEYL